MAETAEVAERLRARFAAAPIVFGGAEIKITASFGATKLTEADGGFDAMLRRADVALYEAKHGGRNRVVSAALDFTPHRSRRSPSDRPNRSSAFYRAPISVPSTIRISVAAPAMPKSLSLISMSFPSAVSVMPSSLPG